MSCYRYSLNEEEEIDASSFSSCYGRYINDCIESDANVVFVENVNESDKQKRVKMKTVRDIMCGEEILIDYGEEFWRRESLSKHSHDCRKAELLEISDRKQRKREFDEQLV